MSILVWLKNSLSGAGLSVIPIGRNKRPYWQRLPQVPDRHRAGKTRGIWQPFRWRRANEAQLAAWFGDGRANVGSLPGYERMHNEIEALAGDLSARVGGPVDRRRDEIGGLARDFDAMAERIEELLGSQRRLLRDVSHELRSPLARLAVALELARDAGLYDKYPIVTYVFGFTGRSQLDAAFSAAGRRKEIWKGRFPDC